MTKQEKSILQDVLDEARAQTGFLERLDERTETQAKQLATIHKKLDTVASATDANTAWRRAIVIAGGAAIGLLATAMRFLHGK